MIKNMDYKNKWLKLKNKNWKTGKNTVSLITRIE
jgi:hypothetical protein